jgi:hypothetical protein
MLFSVYDDGPPKPHYQTLRTPERLITVLKPAATKVERFDAPQQSASVSESGSQWPLLVVGTCAAGAAIAVVVLRRFGRRTGRDTGTAEAAEPVAQVATPRSPLQAIAARFGLASGQTTSVEILAAAKAAGIAENRCEDLRASLERIERAKFSRTPEDAASLEQRLFAWLNSD